MILKKSCRFLVNCLDLAPPYFRAGRGPWKTRRDATRERDVFRLTLIYPPPLLEAYKASWSGPSALFLTPVVLTMNTPSRTRSTSHPQPLTQLHTTVGFSERQSATSSLEPPPAVPQPFSLSNSHTKRRNLHNSAHTHTHTRARSSSASLPSEFLFTPSQTPIVRPRSGACTPAPAPRASRPAQSRSSPHLASTLGVTAAAHLHPRACVDSPSDRDEASSEEMIYTAKKLGQGSSGFRTRFLSSSSVNPSAHGKHQIPKSVTTTPGQLCAGETETETDEPVSASEIYHL